MRFNWEYSTQAVVPFCGTEEHCSSSLGLFLLWQITLKTMSQAWRNFSFFRNFAAQGKVKHWQSQSHSNDFPVIRRFSIKFKYQLALWSPALLDSPCQSSDLHTAPVPHRVLGLSASERRDTWRFTQEEFALAVNNTPSTGVSLAPSTKMQTK